MKLYLVERTDDCDWDEYDAVVVAAPSAEEALKFVIEPIPGYYRNCRYPGLYGVDLDITEIDPEGETREILSSYNAG